MKNESANAKITHRNVQRFKAGSSLRFIDFVFHLTLGLRVAGKNKGKNRPRSRKEPRYQCDY